MRAARNLARPPRPHIAPPGHRGPRRPSKRRFPSRPPWVLGLEVSDVSFDRGTVTIRPNGWRRLKTLTSARVVPLWPQLEAILRPFIFSRPPTTLLFPSFITGREAIAPRLAKDAGPDRCASGVDARRGAVEGVPAYLLRGAAPDARGRSTSEPVHRVARAGTWLPGDG